MESEINNFLLSLLNSSSIYQNSSGFEIRMNECYWNIKLALGVCDGLQLSRKPKNWTVQLLRGANDLGYNDGFNLPKYCIFVKLDNWMHSVG